MIIKTPYAAISAATKLNPSTATTMCNANADPAPSTAVTSICVAVSKRKVVTQTSPSV